MALEKHPSQMDKRTKEYKDWAKAEADKAKQVMVPVGTESQASITIPPPNTSSSGGAVTVKVEERKAPTRPWEKNAGHRPWRRNYFNLEKRRPGFRPRFVDPTKVEARIQRGYVIARPEDYGGLVDIDIRQSTGLGSYISRQGMILMEIPEDGAKAYERQQEDFIQSQYRKMKRDVETEAQAAGFDVEITEAGLK